MASLAELRALWRTLHAVRQAGMQAAGEVSAQEADTAAWCCGFAAGVLLCLQVAIVIAVGRAIWAA